MGVDVRRFLESAKKMVERCKLPDPAENPGVALGITLGEHARNGRDKVTLVASPPIADLGAWLEQLIAESTGKIGRGLIPVDREPLGSPGVYGLDRIFAYERYLPAAAGAEDNALKILEHSGHTVVHLNIHDIYDLGQEFFRWEIAIAVAGSIIGIDPFDQPDVEASKIATKKLTSEYEEKGSLPDESPIFEQDGIKLFTNDDNATEIGTHHSLTSYLAHHLDRISLGDYFALLAYIEMNEEHEKLLQHMRRLVRDRFRVATCLGFGPRFLHSTGQAYKGGPNSGVFLQVTCDDAVELQVPGQKYTFSVVKAAQARGDFEVLAERKRRALRVHLPADLKHGLEALGQRNRASNKSEYVTETLRHRRTMQLGMIGLGRMGSNMVKRLMKAGHQCAVYDLSDGPVKQLAAEGALGGTSVDDFKKLLQAPRAVWVMVPSGDATEGMVRKLIDTLEKGDTIIDGGNSFYKDDVRRSKLAAEKGIDYIDAGTSGGVWGFERGYCLMIGGPKEAVQRLDPIFNTLAPGESGITPSPGRDGKSTADRGYLHCGPSGAGHFAKMVHNGIEYGLMQAYAEGFDILKNKNSDKLEADMRYDINLADLAETWRRGSVIGSWLLDLTAMALVEDPELKSLYRLGRGFWRRALDDRGGHRRSRARRGVSGFVIRSFPIPPGAYLRGEDVIGDA